MGRQMNSADSQGVPSGPRVGEAGAGADSPAKRRVFPPRPGGAATGPGRPRNSCRGTSPETAGGTRASVGSGSGRRWATPSGVVASVAVAMRAAVKELGRTDR